MRNRKILGKQKAYFVIPTLICALIITSMPLGAADYPDGRTLVPVTYVDDDYTVGTPDFGEIRFNCIHEAIDHTQTGGTVFVYNGLYDDSLVIDRTMSVIAIETEVYLYELYDLAAVVSIETDHATFQGFKIIHYQQNWCYTGIAIDGEYNRVSGNCIEKIDPGSFLAIECSGSENIIEGNVITFGCSGGIYVWGYNNHIYTNTINHFPTTGYGVKICSGAGNSIVHNNFLCKVNHVWEVTNNNFWDNGMSGGGNYWKGINSAQYDIPGPGNGVDHYVLSTPWEPQPPQSPRYTPHQSGIPEI